jgi:hypothetical protein
MEAYVDQLDLLLVRAPAIGGLGASESRKLCLCRAFTDRGAEI